MAKKDYEKKDYKVKESGTKRAPIPSVDDFGITTEASSSSELKAAAHEYAKLKEHADSLRKEAAELSNAADLKRTETESIRKELEDTLKKADELKKKADELKKALLSASNDSDSMWAEAGKLLEEANDADRKAEEKAYQRLVKAVEASKRPSYIWPVNQPSEGGLTPGELRQLKELLGKLK